MAEVDVEGILGLLIEYGYLIVFVAAIAEAMPVLGWLVPGQAIIILAGAAAAAGYLSLTTIILISIPAGILGDAVGYLIGRRYGRALIEKHASRLRITPRHIERSERLFAKYGVFALVLARFSFLTRGVGPILAGMARVPGRVFWPVNVVGALAWSFAYAALGYVFGVGFLQLQGVVGKILAWTLLGVVGLYAFYRVLRKYADQFTREDLYLAVLAAAGGAVFGVIADRLQKLGSANALDAAAPALQALLAPLAPLLKVLGPLMTFQVLGTISLGVLVWLSAKRRWVDATLVGLGMGGVILLVETMRRIFRAILPAEVGEGFPSESAALPIVLAGVACYLVATQARRAPWAWATLVAGAGLCLLSIFARLAQGDERPSGVLAGLALGTAWLCVTLLVLEFRLKRTPTARAENP